jgi:hypothetical protein
MGYGSFDGNSGADAPSGGASPAAADAGAKAVAVPSSPVPRAISVASELDFIGHGRFTWVMLGVLGLANASDAVELLALSFIIPALESGGGELANVTKAGQAALQASIFAGMLVGGLFFGVAADALGRRSTLAISLAINACFGLLSAASNSFPLLVFARVMGGFGVGGSIPGGACARRVGVVRARRSARCCELLYSELADALHSLVPRRSPPFRAALSSAPSRSLHTRR